MNLNWKLTGSSALKPALLLCLACLSGLLAAQAPVIRFHARGSAVRALAYPQDSLPAISPSQFFQSVLGLGGNNRLVLLDSSAVGASGLQLSYRQYVGDMEVVNSRLTLHYRNGLLERYLGYYIPVDAGFKSEPALTRADAERRYRNRYLLSDTAKIGFNTRRVILENPDTAGPAPLLCYRIEPVEGYRGATLYMDAGSGAILFEREPYSAGNFNTRYYGYKPGVPNHQRSGNSYGTCFSGSNGKYMLVTHQSDCPWRFIVTELEGDEFYQHGDCSVFCDGNDNTWTPAEHPKDYAQDAYWGVYSTLKYFGDRFNYHGLNGVGHCDEFGTPYIFLSVLVDVDNFRNISGLRNNALFYRPGSSTYESGSKSENPVDYLILTGQAASGLEPFTSIDIMAHEVGHGIDDYISEFGLYVGANPEVYALAEGLSDIWAAVIEHRYVHPEDEDHNDIWTIGELPMRNANTYLRNMKMPEDPNAQVQMVKKYGNAEIDWIRYYADASPSNDYNKYPLSGVLSHWFYILVNGDNCTVEGIGMEKAAKLVFYTQRYFSAGVDNFVSFAQGTWDVMTRFITPGSMIYDDNTPIYPYDQAFTAADRDELAKAWAAVNISIGTGGGSGSSGGEAGGEISGNVTWSGTKLIISTVTVNPGASLTITGMVRFQPAAALIIKPGGKVTVDGGTLTNYCNSTEMWPGITVLGHSSVSQFDFTANGQGSLYIRNGATYNPQNKSSSLF